MAVAVAKGKLSMFSLSSRHEKEILLSPDQMIVTKTDLKGQITYANRTFMEIADFQEHEVLNKPHNLIRHPDMPRGVFRLMWKTLQKRQEFFGVVKNYTSNRKQYYWVLANITPDFNNAGQLAGFYSVRRPASRAAIAALEPIYQQMRQIEAKLSKVEGPDASVTWLLEQVKMSGAINYEAFVISLNKDIVKQAKNT